MRVKFVLWTGAMLLISGCSQYAETFDCKPGMGVGCQSLNTVNEMIDQGTLPSQMEQTSQTSPTAKKKHQQKVWIAGYEDPQGHYHDPSYEMIGE